MAVMPSEELRRVLWMFVILLTANLKFLNRSGGGGAHVKILTGMLVLFFWVWNLAKSYFSGLANFLAILQGFAKFPLFLGSDKFPAIFWVFQVLYHTLKSFEWRTHGTEKHKIIVAFHIYSNFDKHCILSHSIFLVLNFGAFYFFGFEFRVILFCWVVEICSRTSIPVKEMLVCPPPRLHNQ